jgi:glyoxylate reductase
MEDWNIGNVRAAVEKGRFNNIVPEQADYLEGWS